MAPGLPLSAFTASGIRSAVTFGFDMWLMSTALGIVSIVPTARASVVGSYTDRVSPRLTAEFQALFHSLATRRVELLPRVVCVPR